MTRTNSRRARGTTPPPDDIAELARRRRAELERQERADLEYWTNLGHLLRAGDRARFAAELEHVEQLVEPSAPANVADPAIATPAKVIDLMDALKSRLEERPR